MATKVSYIDIGSYVGIIPQHIIELFLKHNIDYDAHVFEPCVEYSRTLRKRLSGYNNVNIYQKAAYNENCIRPLYHAIDICGHSLCNTKFNIDIDDYEEVECVKFSEWFNSSINNTDSLVILRLDIEGAEYELYNDIIDSGINNKIDLYLGTLEDIYKLTNITNSEARAFESYLLENGINPVNIDSPTVLTDIDNIEKYLLTSLEKYGNRTATARLSIDDRQ